jgi:hypothetical protein
MQGRAVRRIDLALHDLRPVAVNIHAHDADFRLRRRRPGRRLEFGQLVRGSHVDPDEAAGLPGGVGFVLHLVRKAARGLRRHFQDVPVHVELPAVIEAAQAALLVTAQRQRGLPVRAGLAEYAEPALRVAESHEIFAQQAKPDRCTVRFAQLLAQRRWNPVTAHQAPHGSVPLDPAQQIVFRRRQHRKCSVLCARRPANAPAPQPKP